MTTDALTKDGLATEAVRVTLAAVVAAVTGLNCRRAAFLVDNLGNSGH